MYDYSIIGGGIVGLSVGMELSRRYPNAKIVIVEKESELSLHQTGRNSGVIHSGIYYKPGSLKAKLARTGNQQIVEFCKEHGIEHDICGKVIVATNKDELTLLANLYDRGVQNQLDVEKVSMDELNEIEPHVRGVAAIRVPSTGIVNYRQVAEVFADKIQQNGGEISLNTEVQDINTEKKSVELKTTRGVFKSRFLINCSGLFSDRITEMANIKTDMKIVPFRGEYFELKPEKHHLVKNLIYPVPNPDFPFLGVHFTRMMDGRVLIGPNAVLSFKREGYNKTDFQIKDFMEATTYPGFLKLAGRNLSEGLKEMYRSYSKKALIKDVQRFIPEIEAEDIVPGKSGVRAQALDSNGSLIDDFMIIKDKRAVHVCNAPSPAATASIEIGKEIVNRMENYDSPVSN
ncbi:L-2-hydroxyglutarate oxidase [Halobacillus shinanisalinarum]|uniref:L-2-hydroxyglutarate oxidase n=1 Tax=Halobacillus shinanisalinarum TaxID=2932258 RepID=A0ABY4H5L6_9BACI|nr:L-2-hydroxyglutarate oxidase [Halobacillus shinanisalinarum]UOQ95743.1 L-2-hydroxyglutarate oxidase [Halobacillus shinanisalinarum]